MAKAYQSQPFGSREKTYEKEERKGENVGSMCWGDEREADRGRGAKSISLAATSLSETRIRTEVTSEILILLPIRPQEARQHTDNN